ncbi:MAG TPA: 1,4-dihydroxy-2-naphthoate octaprenyltransferase [Flavobacteriaceae bacterium]|nr:1,4-dihydroxy-2-naphthoate octaprenyltransferase [Flavobacteriaceae bacterium]
MSNLKTWISAFRLRTLPLSVSGIIVASSLAEYNGDFNWATFVFAILTTLSFQILSNIANDYGDGIKGADNQDRIGPERAIQSGKIKPEHMLYAIRTTILISLALAFVLILVSFGLTKFFLALIFFILGILSVYAAINYTVGSNPYGYRGLGDIFVFVFFGLVSVVGCYVLYAKTVDHVVFLPACTIGLLSAAVLNLNNMRDIESDRAAGKNTLAVYLGLKRSKSYHIAIISLAIVLSALFGILYYVSSWNLIYFVMYIPLLLHLKRVVSIKDPKAFDPELKVIALSTFALSVLLAIGHLL